MTTINKNTVEEIRIEQTDYKGHHLIDARVYYLHEDGTWRPSKKGLALKPEIWREVIEAVDGLSVDK